jgi:hypothetical protein
MTPIMENPKRRVRKKKKKNNTQEQQASQREKRQRKEEGDIPIYSIVSFYLVLVWFSTKYPL